MLAPILVTKNTDAPVNSAAAVGTLRQAIFDAENNVGHDDITFDPAVFNTQKTILLTLGELVINQSVTIDGTVDGEGPSNLSLGITISGGNGEDEDPGTFDGFRIFNISDGTVALNSLELTGGDRADSPFEGGGAIFSSGANLTLRDSIVSGNATTAKGGGVFFSGNGNSLRVYSSTISHNRSGYYIDSGSQSSDANGGGLSHAKALRERVAACQTTDY